MRSWVFAASLMAAAVTTGAQAADLDEGPPPDRYGSAYDDPRYADIYKYPRPPAYGVPPPGPYAVVRRPMPAHPMPGPPPYAGPPIPRERVYRDDGYGYDRDYAPGPRRYSYAEPARPTLGAARRASWSRSGCTATAGATSTTAMCAATSPPSTPGVPTAGCSCSPSIAAAARSSGPTRSSGWPRRSLCLWAAAAALGPGLLSDCMQGSA